MSKLTALIPLREIDDISIYINSKRKTMSAIKKETGADYILNGGLFNPDWTPCPILKVDGNICSKTPWTAYGFGWDSPIDFSLRADYGNVKNFISCVCILKGGTKTDISGIPSALGGARQRSAVGLSGDSVVLYCTNSGTTPHMLQGEMMALGCTDAVMLDGGGSSSCNFDGKTIETSRIIHNYILVHKKKVNDEMKTTRQKLVESAASQIGVSAPSGDDKYIAWYNKTIGTKFGMNVPWCAIFVSWNLRQAGVPEQQAPSYSSCTAAMSIFKKLGTWRSRSSYSPKPGDLIFFDWNKEPSVSEHTGIVEKADRSFVYTIEGNTGSGVVARKKYPINDVRILGYVEWDGKAHGASSGSDVVRMIQSNLNSLYQSGLSIDGSFGPASRNAMIRAVQTEINRSYGGKLSVDGSFGPSSKKACPDIKAVTVGRIAWLIQACLNLHGLEIDMDSSYGPSTAETVKKFQSAKGLSTDGICGPKTFERLLMF